MGTPFTDDAARELVDALGADMLTMKSEVEKLLLYASAQGAARVELVDVETMVSAAKQRSLYELTDAISLKDAPRALALLQGLLNASEGGDEAAIGHVFMLAKTFRQMLILNEKQVKDQRAMWQVLWPGFRVAPFAADAVDCAGAAVSRPQRVDAGAAVDCEGGCGAAVEPAGQAAGAGAAGDAAGGRGAGA